MSELGELHDSLKRCLGALPKIGSEQDWKSAEEQLRALKLQLRAKRQQLEQALEKAQAADDRAWWRKLKTAPEVQAHEDDLMRLESMEDRLAKGLEQLYESKAQKGASELAWRAEQLQNQVQGSWTTKAQITAAALLSERAEALDLVQRLTSALSFSPRDEGALVSAALLMNDPVETIRAKAEALRAELGDQGPLIAAALGSARSPEDAARLARALRPLAGPQEIAAALASDADRELILDNATKLRPDLPGDARAKRHALAASYLAEMDRKTALQTAQAISLKLRGDPKSDPVLLAAGMLRPDRLEALERLSGLSLGGWAASATLQAAALLSAAPIEDSLATIKQSQQRLSGSWESEAMIIGAWLLAGERSSMRIKTAYLLPDLLCPLEG